MEEEVIFLNRITLSWLMRTFRPFSVSPSSAYQTILSDFFAALTGNSAFFVESTSSSRIMNNEYDVPKVVREVLVADGEEIVRQRGKFYFEENSNPSLSHRFRDRAKEEIVSFDLSDSFKSKLSTVQDPAVLFSMLALVAVQTNNRENLVKSLFKNNRIQVNLISGDLISIGFNKKSNAYEKIVVIPVDDRFTMKRYRKGDPDALVSKDSIHGKYLLRLEKAGWSIPKLKNRTSFLKHPNGTTMGKVSLGSTEFWEIPVARFNNRGQAISSVETISKAVSAILDEYDVSGQGIPIFIPLLGTGRSRVFKTNEDSLSFLKKMIIGNPKLISGIINLVVYKKTSAV